MKSWKIIKNKIEIMFGKKEKLKNDLNEKLNPAGLKVVDNSTTEEAEKLKLDEAEKLKLDEAEKLKLDEAEKQKIIDEAEEKATKILNDENEELKKMNEKISEMALVIEKQNKIYDEQLKLQDEQKKYIESLLSKIPAAISIKDERIIKPKTEEDKAKNQMEYYKKLRQK
jgi:hypothetical protein